MTLPTDTPDERVFVGTDITRDATPVVYTITEDGRIYVRGIQVGQAPPLLMRDIAQTIVRGFHIGGRATGRTARAETVKELYERHLVDRETFERERLGNWADEDPRTCAHPMTDHVCDETCTCPNCNLPLLYSARFKEHACPDPNCVNAHGLNAPACPPAPHSR